MDDSREALVWGAFVADSLALGAHWIYDPEVIRERFGTVDRLLEPSPDSYHAGKKRGAFTHYGDQTLVLLESMAQTGGTFDLDDFSTRWRRLFQDYHGYVDKATQDTLTNFQQGHGPRESGSSSADLAGAARIAPIVYALAHAPSSCLMAAREQTAMTHNHPQVVEAAAFFALATLHILQGQRPTRALMEAAQELPLPSEMQDWLQQGVESKTTETVEAVGRFGRACPVPAAFPATVHIVARHEEDFPSALVANVMAGGDSAARGLIIGMVLGAYHGLKAVPAPWMEELRARPTIASHLRAMARD
ncbi:ADP-ribosylglycohydrolase [Desulfacinum hydrothermale DSM 13146]|uniref:ADP-ribosylglycohydrolase n=1 Tax=Desulfacinum hydrothermale DSM 13146 TaxID=1121390 RepID=A0A1W1XJM1_9BACT|nr:ADP-ribosylglycohydrolase family protein [Desulfacinum hydrothermale]SMC24022.1 ADP-ribosylglycohydrolase [Desulfacinum hydrothermale DSM 13146]